MCETILLIDDDAAIRAFISDFLADEGYSTHLAPEGHSALTYLHATDQLPELILLDLSMPGMNGWVFRAIQQSIPILAPIPVVLLSAADDLDRNAATLKIPHYLEKPIWVAHLLDVVERYCAQACTR